MKTSRIASWGLTLAFVPMLALASSQPDEARPGSMSSQSMESAGQNMENAGQTMEGMPRQGGASGLESQNGSMQRERQQQMQESHAPSSPAIGTHDQRQEAGAGSMNADNTTRMEQGTGDIPDQRTQDDTAP
ncbi:hypothetical protein [Kushneria pakistanensis]|nr:hypothetical protein [Kushneria pakistanensis]